MISYHQCTDHCTVKCCDAQCSLIIKWINSTTQFLLFFVTFYIVSWCCLIVQITLHLCLCSKSFSTIQGGKCVISFICNIKSHPFSYNKYNALTSSEICIYGLWHQQVLMSLTKVWNQMKPGWHLKANFKHNNTQ